jgi:NitT/TauT family transport system substrate-binding protein
MVLAVVAGLAWAADDAGSLRSDLEVAEAQHSVPALKPAANYQMKDNTVDVEISEYAGYAGLIVANNGLEPTENSYFFKKHGFKVRLLLSEEDAWSVVNGGKIAVNATTVDVLPLYGSQLQVTVPVLIGYSRGADGLVVRSEIKQINDLKGKTVAFSQFNESDFLVRYLAQQAGLSVNLLDSPKAKPDPDKVNVVACADAFGAGDFFLRDLMDGRSRIQGCMTWAPKMNDVVRDAKGKARLLMTNRNLLLVADILIVNRGFASEKPDVVRGLVEGLLDGNARVRAGLDPYRKMIAKAFGWPESQVDDEMSKVHLANLPENLAFFDGTIDSAGSFSYIYELAVMAYGPAFIPRPVAYERYMSADALKAIQKSGLFSGEVAQIKPIKSADATQLETPILARDVRFLYQPNSARLDMSSKKNLEDLAYLAKMLQVSPGSTLLLRGHVDNSRVAEFEASGGAALVQKMAMKAAQLSKDRANGVRDQLVKDYKVDTSRIEVVGCGWREPLGTDMDQNRRVEVQWFTLE